MKPTVLRASERVKHIVGFSGGIDSQACARWVLNRFPKDDVILTNSDAGGNEHPLTVEFIDWYSENVHPVVRVNAIVELNFVDDVVRWARSARGGRQDMFPIMHERPACESKYGLCE
jgi:3'-phosphoadenosine 5'-phosphosulfate sulfotransferase (PAPS reductase)/FAD synthetase